MKKEEKVILQHLVKKEIKLIEKEESSIEFPPLDSLKSADIYKRELKRLLEELR
jgi:hypothetical protein